MASNTSLDDINTLNKFVNTIRTLIPPPDKFELDFRTPCWYMYLRFSQKVYKMLQSKGAEGLTDDAAFKVMSNIFANTYNGRTITASPRTLVCIPSVYFIGFPRSGSTQLYRMMINHPLLLGGTNKEPHWWTKFHFTSKFPHNILGVVRYLSHFRGASERISNESLIIDASQSTVWDTRNTNNLCIMPRLISSIIPNAKYIVIMRNPTERLYSDFRYLCEEFWRVNKMDIDAKAFTNNASEIFHHAVLRSIDDFNNCLRLGSSFDVCTHNALTGIPPVGCGRARLGISLYHVHIRRWLSVIPRKQFLFLTTEELSNDPFSVVRKVWQFLEIPEQNREDLNDILYMHSHGSFIQQRDFEMQVGTRAMLDAFFKTTQ